MNISTYLQKIQATLASGNATEHSYRPELRDLFAELTGLHVINEPKGSEHGKPDFIFLKGTGKDVFPIAHGEAKDMHISLEKIEQSEQLARYFGYPKLILSNSIEFRFYKNGIRYGEPIILAEKSGSTITPRPDQFSIFEGRLMDFISSPVDTIRRAAHLAKIMGGRAQRIRDNLREMMQDKTKYSEIWKLYSTFQSEILHDLTTHDFADLYAQTLVYGLFVARYHDATPETFSRSEARDLVPASNPLLRTFFDHIAGTGYEKRLGYIVDDLCEVFAHADVRALMHGVYQQDTHDPVIHFYEDFLSEYDDELRKIRGVFYTPAPVVKFIIRAVDDILQSHFGLARGLADTSKIQIQRDLQKYDKKGTRKTETIETHRVQILDPATGTGTFLDEVVRHIYSKMSGQAGMWESYVDRDLLPRIHGFELMMASYTIAHLKLGLTLAETGISDLSRRLQIYLTNSLEEAKVTRQDQGTLWGLMESITDEARLADEVKRDKPVMIVVGNPPYSGVSTNKGEWITDKIEDYKYVDGVHFGEKKHWLQDDYVKFFRLGESLIEKNGEGILAYITNHGYLDNPTFRGMRWHLLQTFDHIYIVDLHGNSKKKETAPDGGKDENVFDIQQGTAIYIGVKNNSKKKGSLATVHHIDQYGKRQEKYDWLEQNAIAKAEILTPSEPYYFFVPKDFEGDTEYQSGFSVGEIFPVNVTGIVTMGDDFIISDSRDILEDRLKRLLVDKQSKLEFSTEYKLGKNYANWIYESIDAGKVGEYDPSKITSISYRPFDTRYTYFDDKLIWRTRGKVMKNYVSEGNCGLVFRRQQPNTMDQFIFCSKEIIADGYIRSDNKGGESFAPLYIDFDNVDLDGTTRTPNVDAGIWHRINESIGRETTPEEVLDYIYAVLHCPAYRDKYREFLKIDFPRVPYPTDVATFDRLVALGGELRSLHLLESLRVQEYITTFPVAGSGELERISYTDGRVYINRDQYFGDVPEVAWSHYIGGYQPAQKWLKDRKGRTLTWEDIAHYQEMIVALTETARIMGEIDGVLDT